MAKIKKSKLRINIILFCCTLLICIVLAEGVSRLLLDEKQSSAINSQLYIVHSDNISGFANQKDTVLNAARYWNNGSVCYNVTYTTDNYGRRITNSSGGKHLVVFGDSVTFGEGVNDNETMPFYLAKQLSSYHVYNYAVTGYGPSNILATFQEHNLSEEVPETNGVAVYVLISDHVNRVVRNTRTFWLYDSPYYELKDGKPAYKGIFRQIHPVLASIYESFNSLKKHSALLRITHAELPPWEQKDALKLTTSTIKAIKDSYQGQLHGDFIVLFHPDWNRSIDKTLMHQLQLELQKENITMLDYSTIAYPDEKVIPCDVHPLPILNQEIAEALAADIKKNITEEVIIKP